MVGDLVSYIEKGQYSHYPVNSVAPLIGNSSVSNRNYHSNEIVRRIAYRLDAQPIYLHAPVLFETRQELDAFVETETYRRIEQSWRALDAVVVNIGNYPSTPDLASAIRLGKEVNRSEIAGRLLAYFFKGDGSVISAFSDFVVQAPLKYIANARHVIGLCGNSANVKAVQGALKTGLLTAIVANEHTLKLVNENL